MLAFSSVQAAGFQGNQLTGIEVMFPKLGEFFFHTVDLGEIDAGSDFHRELLFRQRKMDFIALK